MKDTPAFVPVFSCTHEMVRRLAAITAAREVILHVPLVPEWEVPAWLYGISRQAAGRELARMMDPGRTRTEGKGRATRYAMAWPVADERRERARSTDLWLSIGLSIP